MRARLRSSGLRACILFAVVLLLPRLAEGQRTDTSAHGALHRMAWSRETFVLSEVLEYAPGAGDRAIDFDLVGWSGGAIHRVWGKADGGVATRGAARHGEYQLLYGRLVSPWWDAQVGVRVDQRVEGPISALRAGAIIALQGLAPGWFELEPAIFVASDGNVSFDLTTSYDLFVTQRIVLQPRFESSITLRDDAQFRIGGGLSSASFGLRARVEIRREFAPYLGIVRDGTFGRTAWYARQGGATTGEMRVVAGLRLWR